MNAMNKVIIDFIDEIKSVELSKKGWNYAGLLLVILAAMYWTGLCKYGAFFQLTGFVAYISAAVVLLKKSAWGEWFMNNAFNNPDKE